jgi:hypothetical protein
LWPPIDIATFSVTPALIVNDQSTVPLASLFFKYCKASGDAGFAPCLRQVRGVENLVTASRGFLEHFDQHIWQRHGAGFTCLRLLVFQAEGRLDVGVDCRCAYGP